MLLIGTGRRPPASSECVPEGPVRWAEAVAQVPGEEPEGVTRRVLLESAVLCPHRRGVRWGSKVPGVCRGHGVWGACSQGGLQGGRGGQSRRDGPLMGCTAGSRCCFGCLLFLPWGRRVQGRATGISVPAPGGCWRPPPCLPLGCQRAPRAMPGIQASPRLCSIPPHIGGISLVPCPPLPEAAAPTYGWHPPAPGRRVGWPAEPCAALARGPGPTHQGLVLRARVQDPGRRRAARPPAATLASVWRRFGGQACLSITGPGRPGATGIPWSGRPAGAPGRRRPHPRLRRLGVVLKADLEQESVIFALPKRLDHHTGAVRHADDGLGPRQALGVADSDMCVRPAEHADHPLWVLLSSLRHREGGCQAGVRDGPRMEVRDIRGPDGVILPCGP